MGGCDTEYIRRDTRVAAHPQQTCPGDRLLGQAGPGGCHAAEQVRDLTRRWVTWAGLLFLAVSLAIGFKTGLALLTVLGFGAALVGFIRPLPGFLGVGLLCTLEPVMQIYLFTGGRSAGISSTTCSSSPWLLPRRVRLRQRSPRSAPGSAPARPDPGARLEPRPGAGAPPHPGRLDLLRRP